MFKIFLEEINFQKIDNPRDRMSLGPPSSVVTIGKPQAAASNKVKPTKQMGNYIMITSDRGMGGLSYNLREHMNDLNASDNKTGNKITVAQFDTQHTSIEEFNPKKNWEIKGRGGTCFQPVTDHYNDPQWSVCCAESKFLSFYK